MNINYLLLSDEEILLFVEIFEGEIIFNDF